jgi:DNA helicase II / ATP-dependent DNA helicase PcrA
MSKILSDLNKQQLEAVTTTEGPVLVIAGPGSGKTKTLVDRIVYLVSEKKINPENIMVSTFTEKASKELISRVSNKLLRLNIRINLNEMYIGTLHSLFLRILEENREFSRLKRNYKVMDQFDQQFLIFRNLRTFDAIENINFIYNDEKNYWKKANLLSDYIKKISEEYLDIYEMKDSKEAIVIALANIYTHYKTLLNENNFLDFATIQTETYEMIVRNKSVLDKLHNKLKYIMVDEYQDTNTIQEMILLKLCEKNNNICVVGDDDQGLYRFRGASIRNILEFPDNFNECKKIYLDTNYRSHKGIINFFNEWMSINNWEKDGKIFRFNKSIIPDPKKHFTENPSVIKVSGDNEKDNWHEKVFNFITDLKNKNILEDYCQIAFLFKSVRNDKAISLANYLEENGIHVFSPRSKMFFDREEIRLMIGAIIFIFPQFKEIRETIYNEEFRTYLETDCLKFFADKLRELKDKNFHAYLVDKAKKHLNLIKNTEGAFSTYFYELLQFDLFSKYIKIGLDSKAYDLRSAYNLGMFSKLLNKFEYIYNVIVFSTKSINKDVSYFFNQFLNYLYEGGIDEYEDFDEYLPSNCISFMTIHQSKGMEFPIVFVDSLNTVPRKQYTEIDLILQNEYYHKKPYEPFDETKNYDFFRLNYVAFSRAQNLLVLTCQEDLNGKGMAKTPSKYFESIYNKTISYDDKKFDLTKLSLEEIKEVNIKNEYSFTSHILLYETCPLQYKFFKELEFSPVRRGAIIFGVIVHQTIEDIHKSVLRGEENKVNQENIENWFNENYNTITKSERVYLNEYIQKLALKQVLAYATRHQNHWDMIKEAEVDVSLVKDEYILKGTIDLIKGKDDTVEIVDFKSEKKPDINTVSGKEKLEKYKRQLEVYSHIVEERTKNKVSNMKLYYTSELDGVPEITFEKDYKNINNTIIKFDEIVGKIENKDYTINVRPERKTCNNCDMCSFCDKNL